MAKSLLSCSRIIRSSVDLQNTDPSLVVSKSAHKGATIGCENLGVNLENSPALGDVNGLANDITPLVDTWAKKNLTGEGFNAWIIWLMDSLVGYSDTLH